MIEGMTFGAMWQHSKKSDAANHWLEKQTLETKVGRQMGNEPWPSEDRHMKWGSWRVKYYAQQWPSLHTAACEGTLAPSEPPR